MLLTLIVLFLGILFSTLTIVSWADMVYRDISTSMSFIATVITSLIWVWFYYLTH